MPATIDDPLLPFCLPSICQKKVTAAFDGGLISSDGDVLLLAGADRRLGLIDTLAAIIPDHRDPAQITHSTADIMHDRVLAISAFRLVRAMNETRDQVRLPGRRRSRRFAPRSRVQAGLRTAAGERR
jgi:hypothetical protein